MALPDPKPGLVIAYSYLWRHEAERGLEEGGKDRPCVVVLAVEDGEGERTVTVAPITHSHPDDIGAGVEIPSATKARLGLDAAPSWVVATEVNRFVWPGPDLRPVSRQRPETFAYGFLPRALFATVRRRIAAHARGHRLRLTRRDEP